MRPLSRSAAPRSTRARSLGLAALGALAGGCGDGSHYHHNPGPPPGPPVYAELEPNDSPYYPDRIGYVDPYTLLYVDGHVEYVGFDIVDHIEFISERPAAYDFRIDALSPFGDVDVTIYDPLAGVVVAEYFFSGPTEWGRIVVHDYNRPFQIIVEAYGLDTFWSLELAGAPYPFLREAGEGESGLSEAESVSQLDARGSDEDNELAARAVATASPIEALGAGGVPRE